MATYCPGVKYEDDKVMRWSFAGKISRMAMGGLPSQKILRGDVLRITYPDGRIMDFPVKEQCSAMTSIGCLLDDPVQVKGPKDPAKPTKVSIDDATQADEDEHMRCNGALAYHSIHSISVGTGYWATSGSASDSTITVTATYVPSGLYTFNVGYSGPRYGRMCV